MVPLAAYWKGCETGKSECKPLELVRASKSEKRYLILPCGGTETAVYLSGKDAVSKQNTILQEQKISHSQCPPIFELTNLNDGKYYAYMLSCGLGGQIEINLKTNTK